MGGLLVLLLLVLIIGIITLVIWRVIVQRCRKRKAMDEANQSILEIIETNARRTGTYTAGLLVLLPFVPVIATIISIITLVILKLQVPQSAIGISWVTVTPFLVGTISILLLWLLLARLCIRFTAVDRAHAKSYHGLLDHLSRLNAFLDSDENAKKETLDILRRAGPPPAPAAGPPPAPAAGPPPAPAAGTDNKCAAKQEVRYCRNAICLALMQQSTSWAMGNGYAKVWDWMNRAEESLIFIAPLEQVVGDAVFDEMRLNDSKIANSEEWTNKLRSAVKILNNGAVLFLKPAAGTNPRETETIQQNQTGVMFKQQEELALAVLRKVRETINDFNAKSWEGLVNARNQLLASMILVGLATYGFVELAIFMQAKTPHIVVATIFAFIGALAGLIGRLSLEAQTETSIDDYHLTGARLLVTPLLSALAAVLGVLLVAKVSNLDQIYTFNALVPNLIIAATFGLTPNLLINQLQHKANNYTENLQSTKPTSGK